MARDRSAARSNARTASSSGTISVSSGATSIAPEAMKPTAQANSAIEAEGAAQLDLLGHDRVDRQRHLAADAELDDDARRVARRASAEASAAAAAGGFEHHVEIAFVRLEASRAPSALLADVDRLVGAELARHASGASARSVATTSRRAGVAGDEEHERADRAGAGHQHALAQQRPAWTAPCRQTDSGSAKTACSS